MVGLGAGALAVAVLQTPSVADEVGRAAYAQPKAGSWKFKDGFGDSEGTLTVKAGTKGKSPKVKSLKFTVTQQDNGAGCPAPGAVVNVKGSFALRKAPKWAEDDYDNKLAWITAKKDKVYDDDYPNLLGMKPVPASVTVGAESRVADLAIFFIKDNYNKPHKLTLSMRLYADGGGYCLFDGRGKPGK
jgi:hypothetical protein